MSIVGSLNTLELVTEASFRHFPAYPQRSQMRTRRATQIMEGEVGQAGCANNPGRGWTPADVTRYFAPDRVGRTYIFDPKRDNAPKATRQLQS